MAELSRRIAESNEGNGTGLRNMAASRRVHDVLCLAELPVLIDQGLLEYEDGVLLATGELEAIEAERAPDPDDARWFRHFALSAAVVGCLTLAALAGILPPRIPALLIATLLGVLALFVLPLSKRLDCVTSSQ